MGTVILHLCGRLNIDPEFVALIKKWQASRMGVYELVASSGETVTLRELVTDQRIDAIIATTPYEVVDPPVADLLAYFERTLPNADRHRAYASLMKWGATRETWHDYIAETYVGHEQDVIRLSGLPDVS